MISDPCGCREPSDLPKVIENRPALPSVRYRIGTYATFRRAMLAEISAQPSLNDWRVREDDDFGIALIDMWAYLCDILTFYQERTANEAFLRTATQHESVALLAATLDYKPSPGMAAQTYLAFDAEKDQHVAIRIGLKVQSVPGQDEKPQKFETLEAITAYSSLNRIGLKLRQQQTVGAQQDRLVLAGIATRLSQGDHLLLMPSTIASWELHQVKAINVDSLAQTTTVELTAKTGADLGWPTAFAFRQQASLFGYNAPDWNTIPTEWKAIADRPSSTRFEDWNAATLPEDQLNPQDIYLDKAYSQVLRETWAMLMGEPQTALFNIKNAVKSSRTNYTLSGSVTKITVEPKPDDKTFGIRSTSVLVQSEELALGDVPIEVVAGLKLTLDGSYPNLAGGWHVLLHGERVSGEVMSEMLLVDRVDLVQGLTVLTLHENLAPYKASTLTLYGNVALGGHGESLTEEPLGSGDAATAFQSFAVPKAPVTFVPHAGSPHGAKNTLVLRVGGVQWDEAQSLFGRGSSDAVYTTQVDTTGHMSVTFGDGRNGARLPTGRQNVTAAYRRGLGLEGNVGAGALTNLLDRPVGLSSVLNPERADGGADAELIDQTRQNAPNSVRTFGRIVSLNDFEDAAREYAGIEKARASLERNSAGEEFVRLTVAGFAGGLPGNDALVLLKADLDSRRDRNQKLAVHAGGQLLITIGIEVDHAQSRKASDVKAAVGQAILDYLAWDRVEFGQTIELSDVYRVVQGVPGVVGARVIRLDKKGWGGVKTTLTADSTELPVLQRGELSVDDWTPEVS